MNPSFQDLSTFLSKDCQSIPLKKLVVRPLSRGVQPPKASEEDVESGMVIGVTELRDGEIDTKNARRIPIEFCGSNQRRAGIQNGDILVASTGATIGKLDVFESEEIAIANNHVTIVRCDTNKLHTAILTAILRSKYFQLQIERDRSGSAQPEIYPPELNEMLVPLIASRLQLNIASEILRLESEIRTSIAALRKPEDVINEILCTEFKYPIQEHIERSRARCFSGTMATLSRGFMLRGSVKYHHPDFELTEQFYASVPHKRVKAFLAVPIRLGATASLGSFIEDGEAYYIHPGATKRQDIIALDDCHQITQEFFDATYKRFGLRNGDVIINRSGVAIGKVAIWTNDVQAVASDFTMRVRFNERMNPFFAWYFFRSVMFQAQIERELRGSSVPNIFPPELERMHIISCDRLLQDSLATRISSEIASLEAHRSAIKSKRNEIDKIIDNAVKAG